MAKNDDFTPDNFNEDDTNLDVDELNLSDAVEPKFQPLAVGTYDAEIVGGEYGLSARSNAPTVTLQFGIDWENDKGETVQRKVYMPISFLPDQRGRAKRIIATIDPEYDLEHVHVRELADELSGKTCKVKLGIRTYDGRRLNNVRDVLPAGEGAFLPAR